MCLATLFTNRFCRLEANHSHCCSPVEANHLHSSSPIEANCSQYSLSIEAINLIIESKCLPIEVINLIIILSQNVFSLRQII